MSKRISKSTRPSKKTRAKMYWEALISDLPAAFEPALSVWLFDHACQGTQEVLDFNQPNLKYEATIKPHAIINISAFFGVDAKEEVDSQLLHWLHERSTDTKVTWTLRATQDWLKEWKKHFAPLKVGSLNVAPSWRLRKSQKLNDVIVIEPGMAFGTGTHATTRFAMKMLEVLATNDNEKSFTGLNEKSVLDVGAGSGILSVAAERFCAHEVLAIDNDPEAWRECKKTFKLNKTRRCRVTEKQLHQIRKRYDVVIANIIDGILMDLRRKLWAATKDGGHLVLSGILADGAKAFKKDFMRGLSGEVIEEFTDGEWTSLLIKK